MIKFKVLLITYVYVYAADNAGYFSYKTGKSPICASLGPMYAILRMHRQLHEISRVSEDCITPVIVTCYPSQGM